MFYVKQHNNIQSVQCKITSKACDQNKHKDPHICAMSLITLLLYQTYSHIMKLNSSDCSRASTIIQPMANVKIYINNRSLHTNEQNTNKLVVSTINNAAVTNN